MLSLIGVSALLAAVSTALPAPEPEPVEYDDVCEPPQPYPVSSLGPGSNLSTAAPIAISTTPTFFSASSTPFPISNASSIALAPVGTAPPVSFTSTTSSMSGFASPSNTFSFISLTTPPVPIGTDTGTGSTNSTGTGSTNSSSGSSAGNPFAGKQIYANPFYASEVANSTAAGASAVAKVGTFSWLDTAAKVPNVGTYLANIQKLNTGGSSQTMGAFVVYNLPNRDCAASASNGEYSVADDGLTKYKAYIDSIKTQLAKYPDVSTALVIEPDSLGNLVTNANIPNCSAAANAYKDGIVYAMKTLDQSNVYQYLDAGHAGWLGWPANIGPAATLFGDLYKQAGAPKSVRGLATNVANYNAFSTTSCPSYTQGSKVCDEKTYINNMAPLLQAAGFPAHFIIDTGRNGKQPTGQQAWGDWCNIKGAGFGVRPTAATGDPLADAFVWVKPGGESDGTSNSTAPRYDQHCGSAASLQPAPQAGNWFQAYFDQLLTNANPAF